MKLKSAWIWAASAALAIVLGNNSELRAGGFCCNVERCPMLEEPVREQIDFNILQAIGHFHFGLAELEKINLAKLREGRPGPELRIQSEKAAAQFREAANGLSIALEVCRQQKIPDGELQSIQQLELTIAAAAKTAEGGTYPRPADVLQAIRLCTQIVRAGGERAVLHQGTVGHLPITRETP